MTRALVIGIGNEDRGDDVAGLLTARRIRENRLPGVRVLESNAEPTELMEAWRDAWNVYVIDCTAPAGRPGTIHCFAAHEAPLPTMIGALSSHGFDLAMTIELARAIGDLPDQLIVYAIEGNAFVPGAPPHPAVAKAADRAAQLIREALSRDVSAFE